MSPASGNPQENGAPEPQSSPKTSPEHSGKTPWEASLDLRFAARDGRTLLVGRGHRGPLRVQKALYPEGPAPCHAVVLHPPGGIAGGDDLRIHIEAEPDVRVLITTPGAAKWYRSGGRPARQRVRISVAEGGVVEWLPQETIFFDGADACLEMDVRIGDGATFLGLETFCLGRVAAGESFRQGRIGLRTRIERGGMPLWSERGLILGGFPWLDAPAGLAGYSHCATLLAIGPGLNAAVLERCRAHDPISGTRSGITLLPQGLLVARCLGYTTETLREWFFRIWTILRPALTGCPAVVPRLWNT